MFNGPDFPAPLEEEVLSQWFEEGRSNKIGYQYLLIIWDEYDSAYRPIYAQHRDEISHYETYPTATGREALIAAYDLYSESKIA